PHLALRERAPGLHRAGSVRPLALRPARPRVSDPRLARTRTSFTFRVRANTHCVHSRPSVRVRSPQPSISPACRLVNWWSAFCRERRLPDIQGPPGIVARGGGPLHSRAPSKDSSSDTRAWTAVHPRPAGGRPGGPEGGR